MIGRNANKLLIILEDELQQSSANIYIYIHSFLSFTSHHQYNFEPEITEGKKQKKERMARIVSRSGEIERDAAEEDDDHGERARHHWSRYSHAHHHRHQPPLHHHHHHHHQSICLQCRQRR